MRKMFIMLIILSLVVANIIFPTSAFGLPAYSTDAIRHYCTVWNDFFRQYEPIYYIGYSMSDDNITVKHVDVSYNLAHEPVGYSIQQIPSTSELFFVYDMVYEDFSFCVFSDSMNVNLEKAIIYTDDRVINDIKVTSEQDNPRDMWRITISDDDMLYLYSFDHLTLRLTIDGKNEVIDISRETTPYIFDLVNQLVGIRLYSNTTFEDYRSNTYLPGGFAEQTESPPIDQNRVYSFREDFEKIDLTAKSLFYVERYNDKFECTGTASGFIAFDEHLFVTNQHVIDKGSYLKIWDDDDNMYIIDKVIMSDKTRDLAILLFPEGAKYNALELNGEEQLKRGQPVVTIGSPQGLQNTVAYGNISAFPEMDGIKQIQISAPISHGSSGGCLFDDNGKVIGITSSGYEEGQNLGFAIPIKYLQNLYDLWDKTSYEQLGTKRSWDMVGITPSPIPTYTPKPTPVPSLTPSPNPKPTADNSITNGKSTSGNGLNMIVALTEKNVNQYFNTDLEGVSYSGETLTLKYDITPKDSIYSKSTQSSADIIIKYLINTYSTEESTKPIKQRDYSVILKRADGYSKSGDIRISSLPELDTVFWDYEITGVTGSIHIIDSNQDSDKSTVKKEYLSITTAQLFYHPTDYKGKSLELSDLQIEMWRLKTPNGNYVDVNVSTINVAKKIKGYDLCLLCYSDNKYVEIVLENYKEWEFANGRDLLSNLTRVGGISIWGEFEGKWDGWGKYYIPIIRLVDDIAWDVTK